MSDIFRWLGAVCVVLFGGSIGLSLCDSFTLHRKTLQQIQLLLLQLNDEIRYRRSDLTSLYRQLQTDDRFSLLHLHNAFDFCSLQPPGCLNREEADCFSNCFAEIGTAGAAQACDQLEYYYHRFESFAVNSVSKEKQARQLYLKLGFGTGVMAAISLL